MKSQYFFLSVLLSLGITVSSQAAVKVNKASGWLETAYVEWAPTDGYTNYHAYVRPEGGTYTQLDQFLLRDYGTYYRADALGLAAGKYQLKVVPVDGNDQEVTSEAAETSVLTVSAHDRNGYAHFGENYGGVGAYRNDGTLKGNAKVIYITKNTAKTVSTEVVMNNKGGKETITGWQAIINAYQKGYDQTPIAFRIIGTVQTSDMDALESSNEGLQIKGKGADSELNITIEGVGNDACIKGFGFLVRNSASLELRNFGVMTLLDDGISLDTDNDHIWIHNVDIFYGPNKGGDQAKGDGGIDVKSDSKHVTISYCHFWDTGKSTMAGMKSESGENWLTYHHNWFDHSDSRHPRIRTMSVHIYNNYFDGNAKYCVGSTTHSDVFVENNYFLNCSKPMLISKQGSDVNNGVGSSDETKGTFSGEDGGMIKSYGNVFKGSRAYKYTPYSATNNKHFDAYEATSRDEKVPASVTALQGGAGYSNFDTDASKIYSYTPDKAEDVPAIVTGALGAGRCEKGDFKFTFTDADNADYGINKELAALVTNYKTTLVGIVGNVDNTGGGQGGDGGEDGGDQGGDGGEDGGDQGGDGGDQPIVPGGAYECHFTGRQPSSTFYTITGSYSDSKGQFTAPNGVTYTDCLKMESKTSIKFTTDKALTLYLGFADTEAASIKIDGEKVNKSDNVIEYLLPAGSHELTKDASRNLFYINLIGDETVTGLDNAVSSTLSWDGQTLHNPEGQVVRLYTISGGSLGTSSRTEIGLDFLPQGIYIAVTATESIRFAVY